jgi:hypothetical protein
MSKPASSLLLLLAISSVAGAQPAFEIGLPALRSYQPATLIASQQTWAILQDRRGIMLFGYGDGLIEYDGSRWRSIPMPGQVGRSLMQDKAGKIWAGGRGEFGTLKPDSKGMLQFVSMEAKVPEAHRQFSDIWQIVETPQGIFLRSYEKLFRWDGQRMHTWESKTRFEALSLIAGRIYTAQRGIGLQEVKGDELSLLP